MTPKEKAQELIQKMDKACENVDTYDSLIPFMK